SAALPPEGARVLEEYATEEMKRFLSVAAQLRTAGAELARRGWTGVVLKGGTAAADGGEPLDVVDLDLLLERRHADEFAAFLDGELGARVGGGDPGETLTGGWQLASRRVPGEVEVEVHYTVPHLGADLSPWDGVRPTRVPGIHRLADAMHLWHLLMHSVVHHLERRGQLRELVLLCAAMAACPPEALGEVRRRVDGHPARDALRAAWEMAEALGSGRAPADGFRAMAATRVAMVAGAGERLPEWLRMHAFFPSAFALAAGGREYRRLWRGTRASVLPDGGYRGDAWLDRRLPAAAWAARVAVRGARMAAAFPPAWRLHRQLRALSA
ncbi:MAG TPA: nucleotidyltransferase family protein, partial [Longimicrobium sp.]|nr:nucleotidyltransferase family protein [Longimicrobium sp.]